MGFVPFSLAFIASRMDYGNSLFVALLAACLQLSKKAPQKGGGKEFIILPRGMSPFNHVNTSCIVTQV